MNEQEELAYSSGGRSAWWQMLRTCLTNLGHKSDDKDIKIAQLVAEREESVIVLRSLCESFGDNEWEPTDYLPDVIDKHLGRHLHGEQVDEDESDEKICSGHCKACGHNFELGFCSCCQGDI